MKASGGYNEEVVTTSLVTLVTNFGDSLNHQWVTMSSKTYFFTSELEKNMVEYKKTLCFLAKVNLGMFLRLIINVLETCLPEIKEYKLTPYF